MFGSSSGTDRLMRASYAGDSEEVTGILESGVDVNYIDPRGWTPLLRATQRGHHTLSQLLIQRGANVEATDQRGRTPLLRVAQYGNAETARLLIGRGADPNRANRRGNTPLEQAVIHNRIDVLQVLLQALVDKTDRISTMSRRNALRAPLSLAIRHRRRRAVAALLDAGAGVNTRWLVRMDLDSSSSIDDYTPLMEAAGQANLHAARLLLERGANVAAVSPYNRHSALTIAISRNDAQMQRLLIEHGAPFGLQEAVVTGDVDAVARFLEAGTGVDVEQPNEHGATLLKWAASHPGRESVVHLLVERGKADVNRMSRYGGTPLHGAISAGNLTLVQYLIEHGANPNFHKEAEHRWASATGIGYAAREGYQHVVEWLLAHYGLGPDAGAAALIGAAAYGHLSIVRLLLDAGVDPNIGSKARHGRTALFYAAQNGQKDVLRLLLERGARVTAEAIDVAAAAGRRRTVALMLQSGIAGISQEEKDAESRVS
jgi:ankyrin repeat protein